jgi:hypothetical protein
MQKINLGAVLRGGALAAITFVIVEFVLEGAVGFLGLNEANLLREAFPDIVVGGTAYHVWNVVHLFLFFFFAIWVYAAIRPRFGPGPRSALITSFLLWFMYLLFATNFARLGIFPLDLAVVSLAFNLVEIPAAILVGARIYSEPAASE